MRNLRILALVGIFVAVTLFQGYVPESFQQVKAINTDDSCDWPMFGRTPDGNRVAPDGCGPQTGRLKLKWKWTPFVGQATTSPAVYEGCLFLATSDNTFVCITDNERTVVWEYKVESQCRNAPVASNGKVYAGFDNGMMYCFAAKTGSVSWTFKAKGGISCSPLLTDKNVFFGTLEGKFHCLDARLGIEKWSIDIDGSSSSPVVYKNTVIFRSSGTVTCVNISDGKIVWKHENLGWSNSIPAVWQDKVYVASGSKLLCLDAAKGNIVWEYKADILIDGSPAVSDNKVLFSIGMPYFKFICLDAQKGQLQWEFQSGTESRTSPVGTKDSFIVNCTNKIVSLDSKTGDKRWERETFDTIAKPLALAQKKVYIATEKEGLFCISLSNGEEIWDHPYNDIYPTSTIAFDSMIFFGSTDKKLHCIDSDSGKQIWEFDANSHANTPAVSNNLAYFGCDNGSIYCIDINTGRKVWDYQANDTVYSITEISYSKVYFSDKSNNFYCLDAKTGLIFWVVNHSKEYKSSIVSEQRVTDDKLYYPGSRGLFCISKTNGNLIWMFKTAMWDHVADDAVIYGNNIYFGTENGFLYCLDKDSGKQIWEHDTDYGFSGVPVISNDKIYYGSWDSRFYCINLQTRKQIWVASTTKSICSAPALSNGFVYFGCQDNRFYCLEAETGIIATTYLTGDYVGPSSIVNDSVLFPSLDCSVYCMIDDSKGVSTSCSFEAKPVRQKIETKADQTYATFNIDTENTSRVRPLLIVSIDSQNIKADKFTFPKSIKAGQRLSITADIRDLEPGSYPIQVKLEGCQEKKKAEIRLELAIKPKDYDSGDWTSFGRNPDGNRVAPDGCGPKSKWPGKLWERNMSNRHTYSFSPPLAYENKGLFLNTDSLLCVDLETGKEIWTYGMGGYGAPVVWDNKVYFNSSKSLACVDIDTGMRLWDFKTKDYSYSSPIVWQGMVFAALDGKTLNCIDAIIGKLIWSINTDSNISNSLAIFENMLYFCTKNKLVCIDAKSSKSIWARDLQEEYTNNLAIANRNVYLCQGQGIVKCFDPSNGDEKWSKALPNSIRCSPVVWDGKIYIGDSLGLIHCLQEKDGNEVWTFKTGDAIISTSTICEGKLYVGSYDNNLYCLDARTGSHLWAFKANDHIWSEIAVTKGKILFSSVTDYIYCLGDITDQPDRDKPEKLVLYSSDDVVDPCSTLQLHADIVNKYNDVLSGYKIEWYVHPDSGTISDDGLLTPGNTDYALITCKSAGFELQKEINIFNQLTADDEHIEFEDVETCKPAYYPLRFYNQGNSKMKVKIVSTSDLVTISPSEFVLEPEQDIDIELECEVKQQPNISETKFYINIEYSTDRTSSKCYKKIEGLIRFKQP